MLLASGEKKFSKSNYLFASCRGHNYKFSPKWRKHQRKNEILLISLYCAHKAKAKSQKYLNDIHFLIFIAHPPLRVLTAKENNIFTYF